MISSLASDARVLQARGLPIESEIARRGINLRGRVDRCGPCPLCGGHDRFSINTKKQVWNCRGCCVGGDIIALIQHLDGCDFQAAVRTLADEQPPTPTTIPISQTVSAASRKTEVDHCEREQHRKAAWLWSRRRPVTGTIAETYLRRARHHLRVAAEFGLPPRVQAARSRASCGFRHSRGAGARHLGRALEHRRGPPYSAQAGRLRQGGHREAEDHRRELRWSAHRRGAG
jgi:hypothetical protein